MTYLDKLKAIDGHRREGKYAERICSELTYLDNLSMLHDGAYDANIEAAADALLAHIKTDGVITAGAVTDIEAMLSELAPIAKSLTELFVGHAHIDMNWKWGYNETATVTVDTFRTMLDLMREYPDFTLAQSQASTYEIIEKFRPDLLPEIRQRIKEGRWEVTAVEWVEPDKNMPSGESLTRQILEAKKYLTKLLDIPSDKLRVDFVPDTFGHAITVPEILADAGIKYMYHCRGSEGPCFYRYTAPSGKSILAYKEFGWYNQEIGTECFEAVPRFCKQEKMDTFLCVYGVGDHGGGPTRLDIEKIMEYRSWPLTPTIRFGTYDEFFRTAEKSGNEFPIITEERNFLFSGCYTTQSRIKMANRISEARMYETEVLSSAASILTERPRNPSRFEEPWRNILFGHFHDILPGSGMIETREYALGKFQETLAALQTEASASMNAIADQIDTSGIDCSDERTARSEGGGVGFAVGEPLGFRLPSTERGRGSVRILHVFTPTPYDRDEVTELTVWDYNYDEAQTVFLNDKGEELSFVIDGDPARGKPYWGHTYKRYMVRVSVPAFGYTTLIVRQRPYEGRMNPTLQTYHHVDHNYVNSAPVVMENEKILAVFDKSTGHLVRLKDKRTNEELIDRPSCFLRYIEENPFYRMTSWRIGPYMKTVDLNGTCGVRFTELIKNSVFSRFAYTLEYLNSTISVEITLKQNSEMLEFKVNADWREYSIPQKMTPQLAFTVPVSYQTDGKSLSEIPYGTIRRDCAEYDIPSHGVLGICGKSEHIVTLFAETKYGFRCEDGQGQITLLRTADNPDPCSDVGIHTFRLGVAACAEGDIGEIASRLCHPLSYVSGRYHKGMLKTTERFVRLSDGVRVSAIKHSEDGEGTVVRLYSVSDTDASVSLALYCPILRAYLTDTNENVIYEPEVRNGEVAFNVNAHSVVTVKLVFESRKEEI